MSRFKLKVVRLIASVVYRLRRRTILRTSVRWVAVSGTVGKTITRQTIAGALGSSGVSVVSRDSNYVNELGVLCTLFDVGSFSLWSVSAWYRLLCNPVKSDSYFCIELGADFCLDIPWFLARFTPYIVVITADTTENWTGMVPKVLSGRLELCRKATGSVFLSNQVTDDLQRMFPEAVVSIDNNDLYVFPKKVAGLVCIREGLSEPLQIVPYHKNRFSISYRQQSVILRDVYKVTPVCLAYSLERTLQTAMPRSIFIMTEIRPSLIPYNVLYAPCLAHLRAFDELYFIGDKRVHTHLQRYVVITYVPPQEINQLVKRLEIRIDAGEKLAVGIKTASIYNLRALLSM